MVRRTPSNFVLVVCAECSTALSVLFICMYLSFEFQCGFHIAFRLVQADQSVELVDSPLTSLRYTCGKITFFVCRTSLNRIDSSHGPTWMLRFHFFPVIRCLSMFVL
jgi:hypothetical protein